MTKVQATIISLTLIGTLAALHVQADATQQDNTVTEQQTPSSSSKQPQKPTRKHAAHTSSAPRSGSESGIKPRANEMDGMPSMEGMQQETPPPATTQQQNKP